MINYNEIWKNIWGDMQRFGPTHRHLCRKYSELLKNIEYESIVDVGCGNGINFPIWCSGKKIKMLAGVDISSECIDLIRKQYKGEFKVLDIQGACLDIKYDLVICNLLLEHIVDDEAVIKNLYKMANKYLLVTTIQGDFKRYEKFEKQGGHVKNYSKKELERKLKNNGFEIIRRIEWGFPFYSPVTRFLQNLNLEGSVGNYGFVTKIIARLFYLFYFLNSSKKGDVIILLAEVSKY